MGDASRSCPPCCRECAPCHRAVPSRFIACCHSPTDCGQSPAYDLRRKHKRLGNVVGKDENRNRRRMAAIVRASPFVCGAIVVESGAFCIKTPRGPGSSAVAGRSCGSTKLYPLPNARRPLHTPFCGYPSKNMARHLIQSRHPAWVFFDSLTLCGSTNMYPGRMVRTACRAPALVCIAIEHQTAALIAEAPVLLVIGVLGNRDQGLAGSGARSGA